MVVEEGVRVAALCSRYSKPHGQPAVEQTCVGWRPVVGPEPVACGTAWSSVRVGGRVTRHVEVPPAG